MDHDRRLTELEIKIAHQELALEKLEQAVFAQDALLQKIEQTLKITRERMEAVARGDGAIGPAGEKPPHY